MATSQTFIPMRLLRIPEPFDHDDFIFEVKFDGFRALAYIDGGRCTLISRNGHAFKSWPQLGEEKIARSIRCDSAILDGEIVCLDGAGRPDFRSLWFRRTAPCFYAFDLLGVDGRVSATCRCSSANGGYRASCPEGGRATFVPLVWISFTTPASMTLEGSSPSGDMGVMPRTARPPVPSS